MLKKSFFIILGLVCFQGLQAKPLAVDLLADCFKLQQNNVLNVASVEKKLKDFVAQGGNINESFSSESLGAHMIAHGLIHDAAELGHTGSQLTLLYFFTTLNNIDCINLCCKYGAKPTQEIDLFVFDKNYTGTVLDTVLPQALYGCWCCDLPNAYATINTLLSYTKESERAEFLKSAIYRMVKSIELTLDMHSKKALTDALQDLQNEIAKSVNQNMTSLEEQDLSPQEQKIIKTMEQTKQCYVQGLPKTAQKAIGIDFISNLYLQALKNEKLVLEQALAQL